MFNQRFRVGNTFLMHKHRTDIGVYVVAHFLNEKGKIDITIDFLTYSGCKLAIKKFLRNSGFEFCKNNVINHTACLQKLYETNMGCKL